MRRSTLAAVALCTTFGFSSPILAEGDADQRMAEGRTVIKAFAGELKTALKGAMQSGGPLEAIAVCSEKAPAIAARHGDAKDWDVGRTSLKYRNPDNAPDEWETSTLQSFEQRKVAGEDIKSMDYSEFVELDGKKVFRYMKAIPTGEICLNCHGGDNVKPEVEARLAEFYPDDKARGYSIGDIRGAFSIVQPID
jgi:hypothetical protein